MQKRGPGTKAPNKSEPLRGGDIDPREDAGQQVDQGQHDELVGPRGPVTENDLDRRTVEGSERLFDILVTTGQKPDAPIGHVRTSKRDATSRTPSSRQPAP